MKRKLPTKCYSCRYLRIYKEDVNGSCVRCYQKRDYELGLKRSERSENKPLFNRFISKSVNF